MHHFSPSDPPSDLWVQLDKMVLGRPDLPDAAFPRFGLGVSLGFSLGSLIGTFRGKSFGPHVRYQVSKVPA